MLRFLQTGVTYLEFVLAEIMHIYVPLSYVIITL